MDRGLGAGVLTQQQSVFWAALLWQQQTWYLARQGAKDRKRSGKSSHRRAGGQQEWAGDRSRHTAGRRLIYCDWHQP